VLRSFLPGYLPVSFTWAPGWVMSAPPERLAYPTACGLGWLMFIF
jgi:hypothetical protein